MWDKHRHVRKDSRKRAMRAARARTERRSGGFAEAAPEPASAPEEEPHQAQVVAPDDADEPDKARERRSKSYDPRQGLAWTGLILLAVILGGFMAAVLFMLG